MSTAGNIAAAGIGAFGTALGQYFTNSANERLARRQMDFQEDMSNTAVQRQARDMAAAGINPILSTRFGGASTPSGAMPNVTSPVSSGSTSAISTYNALATLAQQAAQVRLTNAQTALLNAQIPAAQQRSIFDQTTIGHGLNILKHGGASVPLVNRLLNGMSGGLFNRLFF